MQDTLVTLYCLTDDYLKAIGHADDPQSQMSAAEVMTTARVAAACFDGNQERSRLFLQAYGYMPRMLSKSRLNRRLHAIPEAVWQGLFALLAGAFQALHPEKEYLIDSLPIPVCDTIRIRRCRLYPLTEEDPFRGYIASKRRYFYGLRVHLVVTAAGEPVEFLLAEGSANDCAVLKRFALDLPEGSTLYADKQYNDYEYEDVLAEAGNTLRPERKVNSKRQFEPCIEFLQQVLRKRIETTFSQITSRFPKSIHAVTPRGFELKIALFVLAFAFHCLH